jgi:hypothetical protein
VGGVERPAVAFLGCVFPFSTPPGSLDKGCCWSRFWDSEEFTRAEEASTRPPLLGSFLLTAGLVADALDGEEDGNEDAGTFEADAAGLDAGAALEEVLVEIIFLRHHSVADDSSAPSDEGLHKLT